MYSVDQAIQIVRITAILSFSILLIATAMSIGILTRTMFDTKDSVDNNVLIIQTAVALFSLAFSLGTVILLDVQSNQLGCRVGIRILLVFYAISKILSFVFLMRKALAVKISNSTRKPRMIYAVFVLLVLYSLLFIAIAVVLKPQVQPESSTCIVTPILSLGFTGMTTVVEIVISVMCLYIFLRPLLQMTRMRVSLGAEHVDKFKPVIRRNLIAGAITIFVNLAVQCIVSLGWIDARQNNYGGNYIAGMASLYIEVFLVTACLLYSTKPAWNFRCKIC
jgi:hypothetical protein